MPVDLWIQGSLVNPIQEFSIRSPLQWIRFLSCDCELFSCDNHLSAGRFRARFGFPKPKPRLGPLVLPDVDGNFLLSYAFCNAFLLCWRLRSSLAEVHVDFLFGNALGQFLLSCRGFPFSLLRLRRTSPLAPLFLQTVQNFDKRERTRERMGTITVSVKFWMPGGLGDLADAMQETNKSVW